MEHTARNGYALLGQNKDRRCTARLLLIQSLMNAITVGDSLRKRLQLSLGTHATLGDEVPSAAGGRAFAGIRRDTGLPVVAMVHRVHPDGPDPVMMHQRLVQLRDLGHGFLDLPIADGNLDGRCWIIDPLITLPTVRQRLDEGRLPLPHAISALRDLARALTAMHRRSITHGAIDLLTVRITPTGARLGGLGQSLGSSIRADLDALGFVAWALLSGEVEQSALVSLSKIRRGVPAELDALCASFCARHAADRPQRAEEVLEALDTIPTERRNPLTSIVDAGLHDARPKRALGWVMVGAVILLLVVLLTSRA